MSSPSFRCGIPLAGQNGVRREGKLYTPMCPRCERRPAKRDCPALATRICATCCATERQVRIECPDDCRHLIAAQTHPAAQIRRQQESDVTTLMTAVGRRFTEAELQVFFLLASQVVRYRPDGLTSLQDEDIADAATAMAATLDAASQGLVAHLTGGNMVSEGLRRTFDDMIAVLGQQGGPAVAPMVATVLRGLAQGAQAFRHAAPGDPVAFLSLLRRVMPLPPTDAPPVEPAPIILP